MGKEFPFVGPSYAPRGNRFDLQRSINLYPEVTERAGSRTVSALHGTPGLKLWGSVGTGPIRGMLRLNFVYAIVVSGTGVYRFDLNGGTGTLLGTIVYSTAPVSITTNNSSALGTGGKILICVPPTTFLGAGYTYEIDIATWGFTTLSVNLSMAGFLDGYFVGIQPWTGQFWVSNAYSTTFGGLSFATAEGSPDLLVSMICDHRELWLFGELTTEVWYNSGKADFPLERISGAFIEVGCNAPFSVARCDNSVFWLGQSKNGKGVVYRAAGYQPQRISDHGVEYAISQMTYSNDAEAYCYEQEGHAFYVLTFPTAMQTFVYDASTGMWHERAWLNPANGMLTRHRSRCQMFLGDKVIVGDFENGNLYELSVTTYTDNGNPLPRIRRCPYIAKAGNLVFHRSLQVMMDTGVGTESGQGSDPQALLRWSNDGGQTWSNELSASIGKQGQYGTRVQYAKLGKARDRTYEFKVTDPVRVTITGAILDAEAGDA